jgi:large subunit ribosomal protein L15
MNTHKFNKNDFNKSNSFNRNQKFNGLRFDEENSKRILGYLPPTPGKNKDRVGRGTGSGIGNFSKRGCKGQGQRGAPKIGFEGGQTPWYKRVPKRGFVSKTNNGLKQQMSIPLGRIIKLMDENNLKNITSEEILSLAKAPFYFKSVKIIGTIDNIPAMIKIQCENFSKGAEESLKENNCEFKKIEKEKNHSFRKKPYDTLNPQL